TSDAIGGKSEGKKRIQNAIIGLIIVACSYLILQTINPALLTLKLTIEPSVVPTTAGITTTAANPCIDSTSGGCATEQAAEKKLSNMNPKVGINNVCTSSSCVTQVAGLTQPAWDGL